MNQLYVTKRVLWSSVIAILAAALWIITFMPQGLFAQNNVTCAAEVVVQPGDTLSGIAGRALGNLTAYQAIVDATNARAVADPTYATIANANQLVIGWKLCIPAAVGAVVNVEPLASPTPTAIPIPFAPPTPPPLYLHHR